MGTVFQHLSKIAEEIIYSITLFKKSNKIITMQVSLFCCVLFFIGYVNGSPWLNMNLGKRSDAPDEPRFESDRSRLALVRDDERFESDESRRGAFLREDDEEGRLAHIVPSVLGAFFKSDEHGHIKVHPLNVASAKALEALKEKIAEKINRKIGEPNENNGDGEAKISAAENSDDVNPLPELRRGF